MIEEVDFALEATTINDQELARLYDDWTSSGTISFHSSGTSGAPTTLTFDKSQVAASAGRTAELFGLDSRSRLTLALPLRFTGGRMMAFRAMHLKAKLMNCPPTGAPKLDFSSDLLSVTPQQILGKIVDGSIAELKSHKAVLIGGASMPLDGIEVLNQHGINAYETYGMTETLSHVAVRRCGEEYFTWLEGVTATSSAEGTLISDSVTGIEHLAKDIIEPHGAKQFKWLSRVDNVINSGGVKIFPENIEQQVAPMLDGEVQCTWVMDAVLGQRMILLLTKTDLQALFRIHSRICEKLPKLHAPMGYYLMDELLRTDSHKLRREENRSLVVESEIIWRDTIAH